MNVQIGELKSEPPQRVGKVLHKLHCERCISAVITLDAAIGTTWSSSPCITSVRTSNSSTSSVKSDAVVARLHFSHHSLESARIHRIFFPICQK